MGKLIDLTGRRFGRLSVIKCAGRDIACAVKYLLRCGRKGDDADALRDLEKAAAYIQREIKRRTGSADLDGLAKREAQE